MEEKNKKQVEKDIKKDIDKTAKEKIEKKEEKIVKDKAIVNGVSLAISPKNSYAICKFIKGKSIDKAIEFLELVILKKKAVPMNNYEVPHRKGNIMAGRYPINTSQEFIKLLKQLKANASVNNIEAPIITIAMANRASRPYRKGGRRAKRANVYLEVKSKIEGKK